MTPVSQNSWVPASPCGWVTPCCELRSWMSLWTFTPPAPLASTTWWLSALKSEGLLIPIFPHGLIYSTAYSHNCVCFQAWSGPGWQEHWRMDPTYVCVLHWSRQHCKFAAGGPCECKFHHRQRTHTPHVGRKLWERKYCILSASGTESPWMGGGVVRRQNNGTEICDDETSEWQKEFEKRQRATGGYVFSQPTHV